MRSRLRSGEELILEVRHHPIALFWPVGLVLFLLGAFIAAWMTRQPVWKIAAGVALGVGAIWALWRYLDWKTDLWAVTSQRVIDESGVLATRSVDSPLETINNVATQQSVFGRMFGFGRVDIQSAAEHGAVAIEGIARPEALRDAILDMKERRLRSRG